MRMRLRSLLGNFLFIGDDVFKQCRILSGGERQRVAIARMLLTPANLILLDEPTHHLDLAGKEVLEEALIQYPGAVVVVTHDRSLMARLATRILAVEDGRVVPYPGGYDDYESARVAKAEAAVRGTPGGAAKAAANTTGAKGSAHEQKSSSRDSKSPAHDSKSSAHPKSLTHDSKTRTLDPKSAGTSSKSGASKKHPPTGTKKTAGPTAPAAQRPPDPRKRKQEEERLTRELEKQEAELKQIEAELADPGVYADGARTKELLARYEGLRREVDSLWARLAELSEPPKPSPTR
jgi:ATP-binding cassette subfamily F protein 3